MSHKHKVYKLYLKKKFYFKIQSIYFFLKKKRKKNQNEKIIAFNINYMLFAYSWY